MKHKTIFLLLTASALIIFSSFSTRALHLTSTSVEQQDTVRKNTRPQDTIVSLNRILFKKNAHASYYADKFNGRRTASGRKFDNSKNTAAHKKLPFGTILRVTNEANGKSVIVEITDRGPFTKGREIDLSRKAFMEITSNKNFGSLMVTLEEIK